MKTVIVKTAMIIGLCALFANSASAAPVVEEKSTSKHQATTKTLKASKKSHAKKAEKGQNAFTRAVQKPLEDVLTPVENTHSTPCNSVVECRKYGGDLKTVWQVNNTTDYSPKDYPERCYVLGKDGKYVYSAGAC
jgi:hypothetical protein